MNLLKLSMLWAVAFIASVAQGAPSQSQNNKTSSKADAKNMSFEDLLVEGKYHFADEAVTTVEQDKVLDGLLGVRKDFKDRMLQSASQK